MSIAALHAGSAAACSSLCMLDAAAQWSLESGRVSACSKEERKAKLAKAAEEMRETGKTEAAFADSSYAVRLPAPFKQCNDFC